MVAWYIKVSISRGKFFLIGCTIQTGKKKFQSFEFNFKTVDLQNGNFSVMMMIVWLETFDLCSCHSSSGINMCFA
jgi:hypothetical protein